MSFALPAIDQPKLAALRALQGDVQVFELVKITWPAPTGVRYYGATALNSITPSILPFIDNAPVEPRLAIGDSGTEFFLQINYESALADEEVELRFTDFEGDFADLAYLHGEGVPVEIFYWFPQVAFLLSQWVGHLRPPKDADAFYYTASAANGFRSALLNTPNRGIGFTECQATFGGLLQTLGDVQVNPCDFGAHVGGIGKVATAGSCTRANRAECQRHFELSDGPLPFLGAETVTNPILLPQIHGPAILASSIGNESNLKDPLQVVFGFRILRDLDPWAFTPEPNPSTPDHGFVRVQTPVCEGPIDSLSLVAVNNALVPFARLVTRLGKHRQTDSGYTTSGPLAPNFSRTALFYAEHGWVNAANVSAANLKASVAVVGLNNIRMYVDSNAYQETLCTLRGWCLMELLANNVWGHRLDRQRLVIADWLALDAWDRAACTYTDPNGEVWNFVRGDFHAALKGRSTQQQVNDLCLAGRYGLPFNYLGKVRILPLRAATEDELTKAPLFTDGSIAEVENRRNIIVEDDTSKPKLKRSVISDEDLPNSLVVTFDDADHGNIERPLTFADQPAQLRAGRAAGDTTRRVVEKKYSALGSVRAPQVKWLGNLLLDLGEFDQGGLENNLRVTFTTWFSHTIELHRYKVIKVLSRQLTRYGFEYFRVMKMARNSDLTVEVTAQAYPVDYYASLETELGPGGGTPAGTGYEAEAESNDLTGGAEVAADEDFSNGLKVTAMGGVNFHGVNVVETGRYLIYIDYKSATAVPIITQINASTPGNFTLPARAGLGRFFMVRALIGGVANTIRIAVPTGVSNTLELDRIIVETEAIIDPGGGTCRPQFGEITIVDGVASVPIQPCLE